MQPDLPAVCLPLLTDLVTVDDSRLGEACRAVKNSTVGIFTAIGKSSGRTLPTSGITVRWQPTCGDVSYYSA
jgi:hypothetical protein